MEQSSSLTNLAKALSAFTGECPPIQNDEIVDADKYFFSYASPAAINRIANPILSKHGLSVSQATSDDGILTTLLLHESGEFLKSTLKIKASSDSPQDIGKALTYSRRYAKCTMLDIATEDTPEIKAKLEELRSGKKGKKSDKPWLNEPELSKELARVQKEGLKAFNEIIEKFEINKKDREKLDKAIAEYKPAPIAKPKITPQQLLKAIERMPKDLTVWQKTRESFDLTKEQSNQLDAAHTNAQRAIANLPAV